MKVRVVNCSFYEEGIMFTVQLFTESQKRHGRAATVRWLMSAGKVIVKCFFSVICGIEAALKRQRSILYRSFCFSHWAIIVSASRWRECFAFALRKISCCLISLPCSLSNPNNEYFWSWELKFRRFCLSFFVFRFVFCFALVLLVTHCALPSYCYKKNSGVKSNRDRI